MENNRSPWAAFLDSLNQAATVITDWFTVFGLSVDAVYLNVARFLDLCSEYGWCFVPDAAFHTLFQAVQRVNTADRPDRELYRVLRDYFIADDWFELNELVRRTKATHPKRLKILRDCITTMKMHGQRAQGYRFNACNLVVPSLVTVVEGMLADFALDLGISRWSKNRFIYLRDTLFSVSFAFDKPAIDLVFDILFSFADANSDAIPASGRRLNRHKIMHGNWLEYGRLEHVIRLFLMVRFLDYIIDEYWQRQQQGTSAPVTEPSRYSQLLSENIMEPLRDILLERVRERSLALPPGVQSALPRSESLHIESRGSS